MKFYWIEIYKFVKNNFWRLLIGTIIISGLLFTFMVKPFSDDKRTEVNQDKTEIESGDTTVSAKPGHFYFFIELVDGRSFTNNLLLEQYLILPEVLQEVSNNTNIKLKRLMKETGNQIEVDYLKESTTKMVSVNRIEENSVLEVVVNVGNETDNLNIVKNYYKYIMNGNIPFLENKDIFVFKKPALKDVYSDTDIFEDITATPKTSEGLLFELVFSLMLGMVFSIFVVWLISFKSKKLENIISYVLNERDVFILLDKRNNEENKFVQLLDLPTESKGVIVCEDSTFEQNKKMSNFNLDGFMRRESLTEIKDLSEINRLIFIIEEGKTNRKWYKHQRELDEYYKIPTFVVQINKSYKSNLH